MSCSLSIHIYMMANKTINPLSQRWAQYQQCLSQCLVRQYFVSLFIWYECCWGWTYMEDENYRHKLAACCPEGARWPQWPEPDSTTWCLWWRWGVFDYILLQPIGMTHMDGDNAPKLLLQIRKLHTTRVPVTFWWWHLPAFAIPLLCGNTLRWWFWNK